MWLALPVGGTGSQSEGARSFPLGIAARAQSLFPPLGGPAVAGEGRAPAQGENLTPPPAPAARGPWCKAFPVSLPNPVLPALRGSLLGLEIGTSQVVLLAGAGRSGWAPHIALSGAHLAGATAARRDKLRRSDMFIAREPKDSRLQPRRGAMGPPGCVPCRPYRAKDGG
jgi:hypothetical protein